MSSGKLDAHLPLSSKNCEYLSVVAEGRTHIGRFHAMKQAARSTVLLALRAYKWVLSPLLPPSCRYVPTCSEYAMEAVARYGVVRGGWMGLWRITRCHPFVKGGFDPVPVAGELMGSACHTDRAVVERRSSRRT